MSYLRGFTAGLIKGQPQIWILDKQTKEIRLGSPNKSAAFSYYYSSQLPDGSYDNSIEESFSKLENDFLGVVERARANVEASNLGGFAPAPTLKDRIVLCRISICTFSAYHKIWNGSGPVRPGILNEWIRWVFWNLGKAIYKTT